MKNRNYQRLNFNQPISGHLQIHEYKGKEIKCSKFISVNVLNISPGGLCFLSDLNFPCSKDYSILITLGKEKVTGCIAWKQNKLHHYMYGVESTTFNAGFLVFHDELKIYNSNL